MSESKKTIRIKWVKSINGAKEPHRRTIRALGFHRMEEELEKEATPQILGMVNSVSHLVKVMEESTQ
ncbi:MAG: 50S ribosomal protein L30 [Candidatus Sumerlaeia bacterium]